MIRQVTGQPLAAARGFWEEARADLSGLPGGSGLNIAYEAVDRHTTGPFASRVALRCLAGVRRPTRVDVPRAGRTQQQVRVGVGIAGDQQRGARLRAHRADSRALHRGPRRTQARRGRLHAVRSFRPRNPSLSGCALATGGYLSRLRNCTTAKWPPAVRSYPTCVRCC